MTTCAECVHVGVCREYILSLSKSKGKDIDESELVKLETMFDTDGCEHFKDRSRFMELPCKVGDVFYALVPRYSKRQKSYSIKKGTVFSCCVSDQHGIRFELKIPSQRTGAYFCSFDSREIGKTLFLTQKEAERALKERNDEQQ